MVLLPFEKLCGGWGVNTLPKLGRHRIEMPTPAQAAIEESKSLDRTSMLTFPADLSDFFMSFDFYDYRTLVDLPTGGVAADGSSTGAVEPTRNVFSANKQNIQSRISTSSFARIALPIPNNLVDNFNVQWGAEQLGLTGGLMGEAWQGGQNMINSIGGGFDQVSSDTFSTMNGLANASNDTTAVHIARRIAAIGSPLFGQVTDLSTGVAENPNLVTLFRGPTLKQHTFTWKLYARTPAESVAINKIIATFKRAMHPSKLNPTTSAFLKYPAECLTKFHSPTSNERQFLYPMRPTVVEDFSINHSPNGMPAFHVGTHDTVGVEIAVKLQETSYYLRDSFDNANEYGSDGFTQAYVSDTPTGTDEEEGLD